ncbi:winged helix-turn-helix transcriptional regulator [Halobacteria archaeon AArc-curdl1]|uniref:Winged helix-turn-helix transcriptional regulator n=1 Tax=Natronosalvus hydrolyticus TaxID=2979988 RepID=A0AAP2ZBD6_9EURY|nr:winged helix-turn-helix transcriptional regulator [Halobacteria archaeon AArc-curdl1]
MPADENDEPRVPTDDTDAHHDDVTTGDSDESGSDDDGADAGHLDDETLESESGDEGIGSLDQSGGKRVNVSAEDIDQRIVDLLSWILDTETRAKIYVHLLAQPGSTSEEIAHGTGLYPSTVREALAELHEEERVTRRKRASEGAGNNPYEYRAIQPSELVGGVVDQVQHELNTIFTLDRLFDREDEPTIDADVEPVTIVVNDEPSQTDANDEDDDLEADSSDDSLEDDDSDDDRTSSSSAE